ncbi:MAG: thioredoxin family protein [Planctomycetaceae bacterium]|nr:thioredoxin family protein [Planctomycetaceae bacterium]
MFLHACQLRIIATMAMICLLVESGQSVRAESVPLKQKDLTSAMKTAREQNLPILLHFYTDWCGPCRRMDQTVFSAPQLETDLGGRILLLKVNAEHAVDLAQKYGIESYPTDVFIDANGRVLAKFQGMASYPEFVRAGTDVATRYQQSQSIVQQRRAEGKDPSPVSMWKIRLGEEGSFESDVPIRTSTQQQPVPEASQPQSQPAPKPESIFLAMDGYCPVSLKNGRRWVKGDERWESVYKQQTYYFATSTMREQFEKNPHEYAPRLLGCDPVIIWETDRAIPGSTEFAAYYDDQLFLFSSDANRKLFELDPERYVQTQHVLIPRDIEASLIR